MTSILSILQAANDFINFLTNPFFLIAVIFWAIVALLIIILGRLKKSKALSVFFPFLAMLKTTRLNKLLYKIARKSPRTWKVIFTFGIFVSFAFTIYGFWYFISNLITLLLSVASNNTPPPESQITPLVPGLTIDFTTFSYLIIPILFVLTIHEFAHAIAANSDGIPVKSTGVLGMGLFFIIGFGAFVEIDEKGYKRGKFSGWQKTRLSAAGSFSNAALAGIALLLLVNFTSVISLSWGAPSGLSIRTVLTLEEGGFNSGILYPGDVMLEINGTKLADIDLDLSYYLTNLTVQGYDLNLTIIRNGETIHIIGHTGPPPAGHPNPSVAYMGITSEQWWLPRDWLGNWLGGTFPNTLFIEIFWLFQIAISVTIFNMMPLPIFDGDKCVYELINHFIKPRKEKRTVKERFVIDKAEKTWELQQVNVESVQRVCVVPDRNTPGELPLELEEHRDYQVTDSDGDGKADHVTFELSELNLDKKVVEIEYVAEVDANETKKKKIMNVIRVIALIIIVGNFIVSGLTLGFTMPFG